MSCQAKSGLAWGPVRGPKLQVPPDDGTVVTDVAADPKTGDGTSGRYRPILAAEGFSSGAHRFSFKLISPGRVLLGVCTGEVKADFSEKGGRALHQIAEAWTICLNADCGGNMNIWNKNMSVATGLPGLPVGGLVEVVLDCDAHTLDFLVEGKKTKSSSFSGLPAGTKLYPCAAFGGDEMKGCAVQLQATPPPEAAAEKRVIP